MTPMLRVMTWFHFKNSNHSFTPQAAKFPFLGDPYLHMAPLLILKPKFLPDAECSIRNCFCPKNNEFFGTENGATPPQRKIPRSCVTQTRIMTISSDYAPQSGEKMHWKHSVAFSAKPVTLHSPLAINNEEDVQSVVKSRKSTSEAVLDRNFSTVPC